MLRAFIEYYKFWIIYVFLIFLVAYNRSLTRLNLLDIFEWMFKESMAIRGVITSTNHHFKFLFLFQAFNPHLVSSCIAFLIIFIF